MPHVAQPPAALTRWMVALALLAFAAPGSAQEADGAANVTKRWTVLLPLAPSTTAHGPWIARIEEQHAAEGREAVARVHTLSALWQLGRQTIDRRDLAQLTRAEGMLQRARQHAGRLEEALALGVLIEADRILDGLLHVPGTATLYAEVQTVIGLVAAQADMEGLALSALRRAAVVDPARGVRAAETTPAWMMRATQLSREVATGPVAEIPVTANVEGAQVYLDDRLQGTTPLRVRATRGDHLMRVEAEGYRALGTWLFADAGTRPEVHVRLSPEPVAQALAALEASAGSGDWTQTRAVLGDLQRMSLPLEAVWLLRTATVRPDRALVTRCTTDSCEPTRRLELDEVATGGGYGVALDPTGLGREREPRNREWLNAPPLTTEIPEVAPAWWSRWYFWGAAAVLVGSVTAAGVALNQEPEARRLRVIVEP